MHFTEIRRAGKKTFAAQEVYRKSMCNWHARRSAKRDVSSFTQ